MKTRPGPAVYNPAGTATSSAASWDAGITSLVDLVAVVTTNLVTPTIRAWIKAADGTEQVWRLLASTEESNFETILRPNDYDSISNAKVWYKSSS